MQVRCGGGMIQRSSWMESNAMNWRAGTSLFLLKVYCGGIDGWGGLGALQWFGDEFYEMMVTLIASRLP